MASKSRFNQGYYKPIHPEKYAGDLDKIRYMSSWELSFNKFLDNNPNILRWASESIAVPYIKPTDGKVHRYYPDYWVEYRNQKGDIVQEIIEIKPANQTKLGKRPSTYQQLTYAVNMAKWQSCQQFCESRGIVFRILTEDQLFTGGNNGRKT